MSQSEKREEEVKKKDEKEKVKEEEVKDVSDKKEMEEEGKHVGSTTKVNLVVYIVHPPLAMLPSVPEPVVMATDRDPQFSLSLSCFRCGVYLLRVVFIYLSTIKPVVF